MTPGSVTDSIVRAPLSAEDGRRGSGPVRTRRLLPIAILDFRNNIAPTPTFGVRCSEVLRKDESEKICGLGPRLSFG